MTYPNASKEQIKQFNESGFIVIQKAIEPNDLNYLESICDKIINDPKGNNARDWAWDEGSLDERKFLIIQRSRLNDIWPEIMIAPWRVWATEFASSLMGAEVEFTYDQFLAKPPRKGALTPWHQDEAYWGQNYPDAGITCWMPFHNVTIKNGCMEFIQAGHLDGIHPHRRVNKSDSITCDVDEDRIVTCPMDLSSVSFHHSKTPHRSHGNFSGKWRKALTQHFLLKSLIMKSFEDDGSYPWKVIEKQRTQL